MSVLPINMSFSSLFKKASNFLGLGSPDHNRPPPLNGEIIYCKNNVCVHPPAALSLEVEHHPGYLNIRSQYDEVLGSTLILTWIPNSTLKKNPRSIENSPARAGVSPRRSPRQEYAKTEYSSSSAQSPESLTSSISDGDGFRTNEAFYQPLSSPSSITSSMDCGQKGRIPSHRSDESGSTQSTSSSHHYSSNPNPRSDRGHGRQAHGTVESPTNDTTPSSESTSPSTEKQLYMLLNKNRIHERVKERTSSSRSVTSIEMDGDNLVVVTEEIDDNIFLDDENVKHSNMVAHHDPSYTKVVENGAKDDTDANSMSSDSTYPSPTGDQYHKMLAELQASNNQAKGADTDAASTEHVNMEHVNTEHVNTEHVNTEHGNNTATAADVDKLKKSLDLKLNVEASDSEPLISTPEIEITGSPSRMSTSSSLTSGPDSNPPTPVTPLSRSPETPRSLESMQSPENVRSSLESLEMAHNFTFPENSVRYDQPSPSGSEKKSAKERVCGVFSVDLGQMRSLRIFYTDRACSSGQLVIASRESQYKILHFHHGGLDRLAEVFADWKFLAQKRSKKPGEVDMHCKHFSVIRPYLSDKVCHPEEGAYEAINDETWKQHMNDQGQIEDDFHLRKAIFFAGLEASLRPEMWPFLLHYFPYNSTYEEREHLRNDRYIEYQNIRKARESMSEEAKTEFWRSTQCTVEKDVVRTDRSHPYFKGEDNPNIEVLKSILLNYATAHPHYGYTQGMSDLLAPVLAEIQHEADAYWCFVGLMQKTIFVSSPKDIDMDKQLLYLRELLRLMQPRFYAHLQKVQDGMELLFCHRWILLCFKREFPEEDALKMWEACWAHYQTDYFHLFICVAIIAVYGEDVVQQDLPADDMLLHFSSLSMHMNGDVILRKARALLHQFRTLSKIPCTLEGLCMLCSSGMWDSGHVPTVECVGNHPDDDDECPYGGQSDMSQYACMGKGLVQNQGLRDQGS